MEAVRTAVILFTRDLRLHDQPALAQAAREAEYVVPLFVLDDGILGADFASPNRVGFLLESLADLDESLRGLGARLVARRGDIVAETAKLVRETGAEAVFLSQDSSAYARRRESRLEDVAPLRVSPGLTVVAPDALAPVGGTYFQVFSPYFRAWQRAPFRKLEEPPGKLKLPDGIDSGALPERRELVAGARSSELMARGGETAGRERMAQWLDDGLEGYGDRHSLDRRSTSRLSPYLHFGCISPRELVERAGDRKGGPGYVRQICWRDFYQALLHANPETPREDLRPRGDHHLDDSETLARWQEGMTGYPIVDAGMRQLAREGWMHNRARLITASFLAKHLYLDWRLGARHYSGLLLDGNVASNTGNWQWVAGTGVDTRPYRVYNPTLQGRRHDPSGDYVRRYVPELAELGSAEIHEPWLLPEPARGALGYPERVVEHREAVARFRSARAEGQLELFD